VILSETLRRAAPDALRPIDIYFGELTRSVATTEGTAHTDSRAAMANQMPAKTADNNEPYSKRLQYFATARSSVLDCAPQYPEPSRRSRPNKDSSIKDQQKERVKRKSNFI
jgi:hypothetical protein